MKIFQELIAYRSDMTLNSNSTGVFQSALNQGFVAYNDCTKVLENFERFRKSLSNKDCENVKIDNLLSLLKAMANEVNIDCSFSNDSLFTAPIIIK